MGPLLNPHPLFFYDILRWLIEHLRHVLTCLECRPHRLCVHTSLFTSILALSTLPFSFDPSPSLTPFPCPWHRTS
jgi:hypothetical protein